VGKALDTGKKEASLQSNRVTYKVKTSHTSSLFKTVEVCNYGGEKKTSRICKPEKKISPRSWKGGESLSNEGKTEKSGKSTANKKWVVKRQGKSRRGSRGARRGGVEPSKGTPFRRKGKRSVNLGKDVGGILHLIEVLEIEHLQRGEGVVFGKASAPETRGVLEERQFTHNTRISTLRIRTLSLSETVKMRPSKTLQRKFEKSCKHILETSIEKGKREDAREKTAEGSPEGNRREKK